MRKLLKIMAALVAAALVWLGVWFGLMASDVARVKASITYHNEAFRKKNAYVNFKADAVYATGFPFRFMVGIDRPTLSMVSGDESYSVSFAKVTLVPVDAGQGRYRVQLPHDVEALYAKDGSVPEHYFVSADVLPQLLFDAQAPTVRCGVPTGTACPHVAADAPVQRFAVDFPASITLRMQLNGQARDANFKFMSLTIPIYQPIPDEMDRPLQLFVGMLREALVYQTP
jgi:hypothetical protein